MINFWLALEMASWSQLEENWSQLCCSPQIDLIYFLSFVLWSNKFLQEITRNITLAHWGRCAHICVVGLCQHWLWKWLVAFRRQAIPWTNSDLWYLRTKRKTSGKYLFSNMHTFIEKNWMKISSWFSSQISVGHNGLEMPHWSRAREIVTWIDWLIDWLIN